MNTDMLQRFQKTATSQNRYTYMSLMALVERIVKDEDKDALDELHENRSFFRFKDSRPLLMIDFLVKLKQQPASRKWCNNSQMVLEKAFDLTLAKFLNMPQKNNFLDCEAETTGPDCRYYYKAFNNHASSVIESKNLTDELDIEFMAAKLLQNLVFRHFYLSCLECRRREQKLTRRISYKSNGHILYLWIPSQMTAKMFKKWCHENIDGSFNQHEIQELIDRYLFTGQFVSIGTLDDNRKRQGKYQSFSSLVHEQISCSGLAETVADEKADNIAQQRPAIKTLGKTKLKELVHRMFESLTNGTNDYRNILTEFDLSKATLSRFAGNRWHSKSNGSDDIVVPDLWKNTAQILANHSDFTEVVKEAGLWKNVRLAAGIEN